MQCCLVLDVELVNFCTQAQEETNRIVSFLGCCYMKRCLASFILSVHICSNLPKEVQHQVMAMVSCLVLQSRSIAHLVVRANHSTFQLLCGPVLSNHVAQFSLIHQVLKEVEVVRLHSLIKA